MPQKIETERLILREIIPSDDERLFILDSDPEVHKYIGTEPLTDIQQAREYIKLIRQQYVDFGIGRWAVIEKESNLLIGWSGIKYYNTPINKHIDFYELGYRFIPEFWGKGYATETAKAWLNYGFQKFKTNEIYAMTDIHNMNSKNVLVKAGFKYIETFDYDGHNDMADWFEIKRKDYEHLVEKIRYQTK